MTGFRDGSDRAECFIFLAAMVSGVSPEQLAKLFAREGNLQFKHLSEAMADKLGKRLEDKGVVFQVVEEGSSVETAPDDTSVPADVTAESFETVEAAPTAEFAHPLKPMGMIDIIYRTIKLYGGNFKSFYGIAFFFGLASYAIMYGAVFGSLGSILGSEPTWGLLGLFTAAAKAIVVLVGAAAFYFVIFLYMLGCLIAGADMQIRGVKWNFVTARSRLKGRLLSLAWAVVLVCAVVGILMVVGSAASIVLGRIIYNSLGTAGIPLIAVITAIALLYPAVLLMHYLLAPQVVVLEDKKGFAALSRSGTLMKVKAGRGFRHWNINRAAYIMLLAFLANLSVTLLVLFVHLAASGGIAVLQGDIFHLFSILPLALEIPLQLISLALQAAVAPLWIIALTLLYYDSRVRLEGLEIDARGLGD